MKKIICTALALLMLLPLVSCGGNKEPEDSVVHLKLGTLKTTGVEGEELTEMRAINQFNLQSENIQVEVVAYDGLEELNLAIITGSGPDLLNVCDIPYGAFCSKGTFAPLTDLVDGLPEGEYFDHILEMTRYGDEYYSVVISYVLQFLTGIESAVGDISSWTLEEFISVMSTSNAFEKSLRNNILYYLLAANLDRFIDPVTAEVDFQNDTFVEILEFSSQFIVDFEEMSLGLPALVQDSLPCPLPLSVFQGLYELEGEKMVIIGYPSDNFTGVSVDPSIMGLELAVLSSSLYQEEAAAVISYLLSEEGQESLWCCPINRKAFEMKMEEYCLEQEEKYDNIITDEGIELTYQVLCSADNLMRFNDAVMDIILEDANDFFLGRKTAEEVAAIIDNRVGIYVSEQT